MDNITRLLKGLAEHKLTLNVVPTQSGFQASVGCNTKESWAIGIDSDPLKAIERALESKSKTVPIAVPLDLTEFEDIL